MPCCFFLQACECKSIISLFLSILSKKIGVLISAGIGGQGDCLRAVEYGNLLGLLKNSLKSFFNAVTREYTFHVNDYSASKCFMKINL